MCESMGKLNSETGCISVTCDGYSCTFFEGHMFPVRFRTPTGECFPSLTFNDKARETEKEIQYVLGEDRWAEFRIVENSDDCFVIDCLGSYCRIDSRPFVLALQGVQVAYRYSLRKSSKSIKIDISLKGSHKPPLDISFLNPAWRKATCNQHAEIADDDQLVLENNGYRISLCPGEVSLPDAVHRECSGTQACQISGWQSGDVKIAAVLSLDSPGV